jgi:hypothetical protein
METPAAAVGTNGKYDLGSVMERTRLNAPNFFTRVSYVIIADCPAIA